MFKKEEVGRRAGVLSQTQAHNDTLGLVIYAVASQLVSPPPSHTLLVFLSFKSDHGLCFLMPSSFVTACLLLSL